MILPVALRIGNRCSKKWFHSPSSGAIAEPNSRKRPERCQSHGTGSVGVGKIFSRSRACTDCLRS